MFQDVSLSNYLQLVPATMQHSIDVEDLSRTNDGENNLRARMRELLTFNPVDMAFLTGESDVNYVRAMWLYARFMQANVCLPLALGNAIAKDASHRDELLGELQSIYNGLEAPFNTTDLYRRSPRIWRQMIMVITNYYLAMMILHMASNAQSGLQPDVHGALRCSNTSMSAFFTLADANKYHASMWVPANTRAYMQINMIGQMLSQLPREKWQQPDDPWLRLAVADFDRYVDMIRYAQGTESFENIKEARVAVLLEQREMFGATS